VKWRIILSTKLSLFTLGLLLTTKFLKEIGFILTTVEMCAPTGVHVLSTCAKLLLPAGLKLSILSVGLRECQALYPRPLVKHLLIFHWITITERRSRVFGNVVRILEIVGSIITSSYLD
jgi:hypothetical protein